MENLKLHELTRITRTSFAYLESNHQLALRSPEFIIRQATPNFPDHAVTVESVQRGETHSAIMVRIIL